MGVGLTDGEAALLRRFGPGAHKPVRGEDAETALALHLKVPCLMAMGPGRDPVVAITDAGLSAIAAHDGVDRPSTAAFLRRLALGLRAARVAGGPGDDDLDRLERIAAAVGDRDLG